MFVVSDYVESEEDEFHDAQEGLEGEQNEDTDEYDAIVTETGDSSSRQDSLTDEGDSVSQQFYVPPVRVVCFVDVEYSNLT